MGLWAIRNRTYRRSPMSCNSQILCRFILPSPNISSPHRRGAWPSAARDREAGKRGASSRVSAILTAASKVAAARCSTLLHDCSVTE